MPQEATKQAGRGPKKAARKTAPRRPKTLWRGLQNGPTARQRDRPDHVPGRRSGNMIPRLGAVSAPSEAPWRTSQSCSRNAFREHDSSPQTRRRDLAAPPAFHPPRHSCYCYGALGGGRKFPQDGPRRPKTPSRGLQDGPTPSRQKRPEGSPETVLIMFPEGGPGT